MSFGVDNSQIVLSSRYERRTRALTDRDGDVYVVPHHSVTWTRKQTLDTFNNVNRFVSANLAVGPDVAGRDEYFATEAVPIVTHRAYTTSSSIDDQAITLEISNNVMGGDYNVGSTGKAKLIRVIADAHLLLGMPLVRARVKSHQDVYKAGWGSYATSCPGNDLQRFLDSGDAIGMTQDYIRDLSNPQPEEEEDMPDLSIIHAFDRSADPQMRYAVHGPGYWRVVTSQSAADGASQRFGASAPVFWSEWDAAFAAAVGSGFVPAPGQDSRTVTPTVVRVNA